MYENQSGRWTTLSDYPFSVRNQLYFTFSRSFVTLSLEGRSWFYQRRFIHWSVCLGLPRWSVLHFWWNSQLEEYCPTRCGHWFMVTCWDSQHWSRWSRCSLWWEILHYNRRLCILQDRKLHCAGECYQVHWTWVVSQTLQVRVAILKYFDWNYSWHSTRYYPELFLTDENYGDDCDISM